MVLGTTAAQAAEETASLGSSRLETTYYPLCPVLWSFSQFLTSPRGSLCFKCI